MNESTVANDLQVVLNGGSKVMESATIPFRWFFSDEIIEKQPTELLVIDQSAWEMKSPDTDRLGERRIVSISRGSDFLQFTSPGHHRLAFIALRNLTSADQYSDWKKSIFKQNFQNDYRQAIDWEQLEECNLSCDPNDYIVAVTIVEIDVPKEFFAVRSDNPISEFIWKWANRWFEVLPRDECAYRKRLIWAFTLQPPVFLIGHILKYVAALVCSVCLPISKIAVLWAGYRPLPLFADISKLWAWKWEPSNIEWDPRRNNTYRQWIGYGDPGYNKEKGPVEMPITGFEVTALSMILGMFALLVYFVWLLLPLLPNLESFVTIFLGCFFCFLVCVVFFSKNDVISRTKWWKKMTKWQSNRNNRRKWVRKLETQKPVLYFEWLRATSHISKVPLRVEIGQLPEAFRNKTLQKARITFWAIKREVCRPFPRS
ncbi:MAG: hypothetical protein WCV79_00605 [Candidatus Paceibacterota bacterium]